jgi:hypothetical protein
VSLGRSCLALLWELGLSLVLILINGTITHEGRWIIFLLQHGVRIWVTGFETMSRVTDSLWLFLGVTSSPLVCLCHSNHIKDRFLERSSRMNMCHHEPSMSVA